MLKTVSKLIIGNAVLPKNAAKLTKKHGSAVAPSDATEKNRNMGAQLPSLRHTTATKLSWIIIIIIIYCCYFDYLNSCK